MPESSNTPDAWRPQSLARSEHRTLRIGWADGAEHEIPFRALRDACGCAHCRVAAEQAAAPPGTLPVLSAAEARPLELTSMEPVGNYGYRLGFSDGHQTGIYSLEQLRQLGEQWSDARRPPSSAGSRKIGNT